MLPDFLGIGAARCGTTALHEFLVGHPEVFVPARKEVHYFSLGRIGSPYSRVRTQHDYEALFGGSEAVVRGEISPSYLWIPGTAASIRSVVPDVRVLAILRSPVERAISDFQYSWKNGLNQVPFSQFLDEGMESLEQGHLEARPFHPSAVLWKGLYANQLAEYYQHFEKESIGVFLLHDLKRKPGAFAERICQFLGISDRSEMPGVVNARPRTEAVAPEDRKRLAAFYEPSVEALANIIGRDLSPWIDPASPAGAAA